MWCFLNRAAYFWLLWCHSFQTPYIFFYLSTAWGIGTWSRCFGVGYQRRARYEGRRETGISEKPKTDLAQTSPLMFSALQFQLNGLKCILMFCVTWYIFFPASHIVIGFHLLQIGVKKQTASINSLLTCKASQWSPPSLKLHKDKIHVLLLLWPLWLFVSQSVLEQKCSL